MRHHAYVICGESQKGISVALKKIEKDFGAKVAQNPDVIVLTYGLLPVDEVRRIISLANQAPITGKKKALVISASRVYHEAQNALLKLFEEPPAGTVLFLIIPSLGQLLPTLRSRVVFLENGEKKGILPKITEEFIKGTREKRSALIKRLTTAGDEEERRENREEALALLNGLEQVACQKRDLALAPFLEDIATFRGYLYDRSAPVKQMLEHLALTLPRGLAK
jgi:DNA polymerase III delta prime subunit